MARIRTIKPDFFRHSGLYRLEKETGLPIRVAFAGLWTAADREGRFRWDPEVLKLDALPFDQVDFSMVLDALAGAGHIRRYASGGKHYGSIPSWKEHQVINIREAKSSIPSPDDCDDVPTHVHAPVMHVHAPSGVNIPAQLRSTVIARDGGRCRRCGSTEDLTVDHIFPRSIGGTHVITNLRCLCRSCNSSRPVAGQALIDDLARDGLSMDDMERMCMHVRAHEEGKGRGREEEEEGKEVAAQSLAAPKPRRRSETSLQVANSGAADVWMAYSAAYRARYGAAPVRNAKVNGQLSQLVARLGAEEAAPVAAFYVGHQSAFYVRNMHGVGMLLADAEKLRTEWATGQRMTSQRALQMDRTATNGDAFQQLLDEAREASHGE
jgi:hypothetical protein